MKNILVCNQKGGVGKTTIADEIAFAFDRDSIPYNFYDLDNQGGAIHQEIEKDNAQVSIIDTPGSLQKDLVQWMKEADIIIIPTRMTSKDIPPLETMINLVKSKGINTPVIYVLNGWNRYKATAEFEEWFFDTYPNEKTISIPQSESFTQAGLNNQSVCDYMPHGLPAERIKLLIGLIKYELGFRQ